MDYKVIYSSDIEELENLVYHAMDKGWKVQGGICAYEGHFYQAMVKEG